MISTTHLGVPRDHEAERATLGSMLIDPAVTDDVRVLVASPEDFMSVKHSTLYAEMLSLYDETHRIDPVALTGRLLDKGMMQQIGGDTAIYDLIDCVPHAASADYYAKRVAEKALLRRAIDEQESILKALYQGDTPIASIIDSAVSRMMELRPSDVKDEAHIAHWLDEAMQDDRPVIQTGLRAVDDIVEGLELGTTTIIGARPSVGKTAAMVSLALNMTQAGTPVGIVSAEMTARRVGRRLICADTGIGTKEFAREKHTPAVEESKARLAGLPLWVDQTPGIHVDRVCGRIRRWKRQHDIQVAFVDYLQLLGGDGDSDYERVTMACRKLQALGKELDIALVALAQVNRNAMSRAERKPTMSDLKGSGEIEQAADVILLLHRESYENDSLEGTFNGNEAQIIVAKNRDGATGTAHVGWLGRCGVFSSGIAK